MHAIHRVVLYYIILLLLEQQQKQQHITVTMVRPWGGSEHLQRTTNSEDGSENNDDTILSDLTPEEAAAAGITSHQPSQTQTQTQTQTTPTQQGFLSTFQQNEYIERMARSDELLRRESGGGKTTGLFDTPPSVRSPPSMRQPSQQPERARHGVDLSPTTSDEEQHNNNAEEKNNEEDEKEEETVLETVLATQVFPRDPAHNSSCLKTYLRQNRDIKTLLAMTHGVVDPDRNGAFIDTDIEPYLSYKKKSDFKPNQSYYKLEIERRSKYNNQDPEKKDHPRPTQWKKPRVMQWLADHPIEDEQQIAWLVKMEKDYRGVIHAANNEAVSSQSSSSSASTRRPAWCTEKVMRLIHVSVEDNVRVEYAARYAADTREELDARSSQNMERVIPEQLIANLMNDREYEPTSLVLPDLHSTFAELRDLSYDGCMHVDVTSDDVKVKMADLKVKLYKIIAAYNISGNGDGNSNLVDEDAEWVPLASTDENYGHWERNMFKDDNRSNFTFNFGEVPLYAWHLWDEFQMFATVLARLNTSQAASADSVSNTTSQVVNPRSSKKLKLNEKLEFISAINVSSHADMTSSLRAEENQILEYEMRLLDEHDDDRRNLLNKAIKMGKNRAKKIREVMDGIEEKTKSYNEEEE